jgi:hypothetical protein
MISLLASELANQPTVGVSDGGLEVLKPLFSACFYITLPASFHVIRDGYIALPISTIFRVIRDGYIPFTIRAADEATYLSMSGSI